MYMKKQKEVNNLVLIDKVSLYNLTDGKTRQVLHFLDTLKENPKWTEKGCAHFQKQLAKAKECISMDRALDIVGYRSNNICELIEISGNIK